MSGYIECLYDGGKIMSFKIEDDVVLLKYNEIWNKIKKALNIKFHSKPVYDEIYMKTKVKAFNDIVTKVSSDNEIPKESIYYNCIAARNIDSVMKISKKDYPQVYLKQCKYEIKRKKKVKFIDIELDLHSDYSNDSDNSGFE